MIHETLLSGFSKCQESPVLNFSDTVRTCLVLGKYFPSCKKSASLKNLAGEIRQ